MPRRFLVVCIAAAAFTACGNDEPQKKNNVAPNNATDMSGDTAPAGDTGVADMAGGTDMSASDMSGPDTSVADAGADASADSGPDATADMAPTLCGNGAIDGAEQCDNGARNDDLGNGTCRTNCMNAGCGDGAVDFILRETCDDGNLVDGDGCSSTCQREARGTCGDGTVDAGEACDNGARNSDQLADACRTDCTAAACGDGVADTTEECDDGNVRAGDGCSATCRREVGGSCGDGMLQQQLGEECDDGNNAPGDGCSATCQLEPPGLSCPDGTVDATEKCDDNNAVNGDGCNPTCNLLGDVTTLLPAAQFGISGAGGMAVDRDRLWLTEDFRIGFVSLDATCLGGGGCTFTTVAGNGTQGHVDNADGSMAQIGFVESLATDGQTVWFFDQRTIRAISTTAPYAVTTVAGDVTAAPNDCDVVDAIGSAARFHGTRALTYYAGVLYFLDGCTGVLRQFDPATAEVRTVAGTQWTPSNPAPPMCPTNLQFSCNAGAAADGYGAAGAMVSPRYMASDNAGMLYITDTNGETLRTYNTVSGYLGTLAGGTQGYVDGVGTAAQLDRPRGLTSDGASLYWGEQNANTVRQAVVATASVSTLAGQNGCAGAADGLGGTGVQPIVCVGTRMGQARFGAVWNVVYHFGSRSIFVRDSNGVRRIE